MRSEQALRNWRAIEALRAGVPNRDAVRALGSSQPAIEQRFKDQLKELAEALSLGDPVPGLLIAGDFGTGKSHLLEHLQHIALESNFVCSKVVISKETPLYDQAKVYTAAIEAAKVPDSSDAALVAIATKLTDGGFDKPEYDRFRQWIDRPDNGLSSRFAATVFVFERGGGMNNAEITDRLIQFWSGTRLPVSELRAWLKESGEAATYNLGKVSEKELARQRYSFAPQLILAAGYAGWVLLVDEVELIGRYSLRQRGKSYAEIARHMGKLQEGGNPGLTSVLAISAAFESEVLYERRDEETIPTRLGAGLGSDDRLLASQAERGMRIISRERVLLEQPTDGLIRNIAEKVRSIYAEAYGWSPPTDYEIDNTLRMRQHLKRLISGWDLKRLYPNHEVDIAVDVIKEDYRENLDLETPTDKESGTGYSGVTDSNRR